MSFIFDTVEMSFKCKILDVNGHICNDPERITGLKGFYFTVGDKIIAFKWCACMFRCEGDDFIIDTGCDFYEDEIAEEGLSLKNLTAEFLSGAEKIESEGVVLVEYIIFYDKDGNGFRVSDDVIKAFNAETMRKCETIVYYDRTLD